METFKKVKARKARKNMKTRKKMEARNAPKKIKERKARKKGGHIRSKDTKARMHLSHIGT